MIKVNNLSKTFKVPTKEAGLKNAFKSLIKKEYITKTALNDMNLEVSKGEILGLVGSNGAGKTTLVKILSGIISSSSGSVSVLGFDPWKRKNAYREKLSLIMGQKAQLWWDLPAADSYLLLKEIYQIEDKRFKKNLNKLTDYLGVKDQLNVPVRKLSLGERMKMELVAALLHDPQVIFLDEPTIGLDIISQKAIREFLKEYMIEHNPIMILTSHYMQDIEELCPRLALMRAGEIIYDGPLNEIKNKFGDVRSLKFDIDHQRSDLENFFLKKNLKMQCTQNQVSVKVHIDQLTQVMKDLLNNFKISNIQTSQVDIDTVIESYLSYEKKS